MTEAQLDMLARKREYWMGKEVFVTRETFGTRNKKNEAIPSTDEGKVIDVSFAVGSPHIVLTVQLDNGEVVQDRSKDIMLKSSRISRFTRF